MFMGKWGNNGHHMSDLVNICRGTNWGCGQNVTVQKCFSHPSLVIYFLVSPPIQLWPGQKIGRALLIANHLDQSLWWANEKRLAPISSYLLHSFLQVSSVAAPVPSTANSGWKQWRYCWAKLVSWAKPAYFDFPSSELYPAGSYSEHRWRCFEWRCCKT